MNLGKLARYLRMLGFDALNDRSHSDKEIIRLSAQDRRIILTRDQNLLKHRTVTHGYWLRATDPFEQVTEILHRFDLISRLSPFTRCMDCNGLINTVDKKDILNLVPPRTVKYYSEFYQCASCKKIYWPGSHYQRMHEKIERLKRDLQDK